jgi:hypothetical protein
MNRRAERFQQFNADTAHQRQAGIASWCAFSARWRAHQGLPLLHPMDVQFLTPQDFCNGQGLPLHPTEQRRLFRFYVEAALRLSHEERGRVAVRRLIVESGDLAFVRVEGFVHLRQWRSDFVYGAREDVGPYESEALSPTRPYGIPVTSAEFEGYWLDGAAGASDEEEW